MLHQESASTSDLDRAIRRGNQALLADPAHFGLAFELGAAYEIRASREPWDTRTGLIECAVGSYENAVELALRGELAGAPDVAGVAPVCWPKGQSLQNRALFAASFRAGVLRAADFRTRETSAAIIHLSRLVETLPVYHPAWYYLGEAHVLAGDFVAAERVWRDALRLAPGESALQTVLTKLPVDRVHWFVRRGDWRAVLENLSTCSDEAIQIGERLTIEGNARRGLGDEAGAQECWRRAVKSDPRVVGVRHLLHP